MIRFEIHLALMAVAFVAGFLFSPKIRVWFLHFKNDPFTSINAEIDKLKTLAEKLRARA